MKSRKSTKSKAAALSMARNGQRAAERAAALAAVAKSSFAPHMPINSRMASLGRADRIAGAPSVLPGEALEAMPPTVLAATAPQIAIPGEGQHTLITDPADEPWVSHAMLLFQTATGDRRIGTGWFISPHTIITAGHCVYDGGWMQQITVTPGGLDSGFSTVAAVHWNTTQAWINGTELEREAADFGVVYIATPFAGIQPLSYSLYSDAQLAVLEQNSSLVIAGFPANPFRTFVEDGGRLLDFDQSHLLYDVVTYDGQSGAPVLHWEAPDGMPTVIGIHHWSLATNVNRALRIGPQADSLLRGWAT
jgi:glutamyl endopeptidase